jgi:hypothetical protein
MRLYGAIRVVEGPWLGGARDGASYVEPGLSACEPVRCAEESGGERIPYHNIPILAAERGSQRATWFGDALNARPFMLIY